MPKLTNCRTLSAKSTINNGAKEADPDEEIKTVADASIPCVELEADVIAGALSSVIRYASVGFQICLCVNH